MRNTIFRALSTAAVLALTPVIAISPAAAQLTIEDYGKLPAFEQAAISPSGNRVALVASINGMRTLAIMEGSTMVRRLNLNDVKVRAIDWASDDILLVDVSQTEELFGFSTAKAEIYKTMVMALASEEPQLLFQRQRDIADATFGWYGVRTIDGKPHGFFGGVPMNKDPRGGYVFRGGPAALYKVDLTTLKEVQIASRGSEDERRSWKVDAAGAVAATLVRRDSDGDWRILNATGNEIASGRNPKGGVALMTLGYDGTSIIYGQEDEDSGESRYFEVSLAGGAPTELFADIDLDNIYVDPASGKLLGYSEKGSQPIYHFADPVLGKKVGKIAKAFPKLNRSMVDASLGYSKVVLETNGNGDSGTWWTVDLDKLTASPLGYERPKINAANVGAISTVEYTATDGMKMDGILTLPPGIEAKNLPVVMLPHGGPTGQDDAVFDWWAQAFAARGYAVFQPNFRGSTNRDAAFRKAGHGEWGRKMQTDISDGMAHLAAQGIVDPKRACIVGASYGGYAALAGVTLQKGLYRCAVAVAGVSDLALLVSTEVAESGSDPILKRNLKAEIGSGRDLKDVSPRRFAAAADAPVLLIHGKDDTVVPYKQSVIMADALKDAGKPHEFVTLDGEDHWLSKSDTRLKMLTATIDFVEKHNPAK